MVNIPEKESQNIELSHLSHWLFRRFWQLIAMLDTVWPQPIRIFPFISSRQIYTQWNSVHNGVGAAKYKMYLCNKSWQESKIIPYSQNIFLGPLSLSLCHSEKIRKPNQHSLFLVHLKFYSLEACGHGAIFRTIHRKPWNHGLLVPGQFSRWFF